MFPLEYLFWNAEKDELYTTTFLTLGNETIGNGWKTAAKGLIGDCYLCVARFRHFVYFYAENRCQFIIDNGFIGVVTIQPLRFLFQ
jgi:hypothetical protein